MLLAPWSLGESQVLAEPVREVRLGADRARALASGKWSNGLLALEMTAELHYDGFRLAVSAKNTGSGPLPVNLGWKPRFRIPSGNRAQALLRLPADASSSPVRKEEVPVRGTPYDFTDPQPLRHVPLHRVYSALRRNGTGQTQVDIADPASRSSIQMSLTGARIIAVDSDPGDPTLSLASMTAEPGTSSLPPGRIATWQLWMTLREPA
jgi:galactose mutarotase-like enzyme